LLVDDHPLFRRGLASVLRDNPDVEVVAEVGDAAAARQLARANAFDIAIIDVLMPGVSGISLTQDLLDLRPHCRVLVLSIVDEPSLIVELLRLGATGFAHKLQPIDEIRDAIRSVLAGTRYIAPLLRTANIEAKLGRAARTARLTEREREIFELVIRGHRNRDIAERFAIARRTVETHRARIVRKLGARSIVAMRRMAAVHGDLGQ
jgi:DNA-binding NarL/FixJ family response regulator